jgi:predicted Rossmann fold flavoprotein
VRPVIVIGGGAAGIMAAIAAAESGVEVLLLEKGPRIGRKLLITGKGRCNLTSNTDIQGLIENIPGNGSFLFSAFNTFSNRDLLGFLGKIGLITKVERGGRVFPYSDSSKEVVDLLEKHMQKLGVTIRLNTPVQDLFSVGKEILGVIIPEGKIFAANTIVATGGMSYPETGSTGDGYRWAGELGHTITPLKPALIPLETKEAWVKQVQGLTLKNVRVSAFGHNGKPLGLEFGELIFTHYGISGPTVLSLSRGVSSYLEKNTDDLAYIEINLKSALKPEQLDARLQRDFIKHSRKQLKNALTDLLPARLIEPWLYQAGFDSNVFVHQVTKEDRQRMVFELQHLRLNVTGVRPIEEAIVTAGGVSVKEIFPKTMASRLYKGLFFAGEVIDIDAYTGGFNLQAAFSSGWVAGKAVAEAVQCKTN